MRDKHVVQLTNEQIDFLRTSLDYSARQFREHDYGPDQEVGRDRRGEADEMIASIRSALAQASPAKVG